MAILESWGTLAVWACIAPSLMFSTGARKVFQADDGFLRDFPLNQEAISPDLRDYPYWARDIRIGNEAHPRNRRDLSWMLLYHRHPKEVFDTVRCAYY